MFKKEDVKVAYGLIIFSFMLIGIGSLFSSFDQGRGIGFILAAGVVTMWKRELK